MLKPNKNFKKFRRGPRRPLQAGRARPSGMILPMAPAILPRPRPSRG